MTTKSPENNSCLIQNASINGEKTSATILIEGEKISEVGSGDLKPKKSLEIINARGLVLTAGLMDLHNHGIQYWSYENGVEDLRQAARVLGQYGTTCILPTFVPDIENRQWIENIGAITDSLDTISGVYIPGIHLEGPFVSLPGAGLKTQPVDLAVLDELLDRCNYKVSAMSIAPDSPGIIPLIEKLVEMGIVPFITHTKADVEQTLAAIEAGARHATHFYDVFYPPDIRDEGVRPVGSVETILADKRCSVDFVCDGEHVHPMAIKAALMAKGYKNIIAITDSTIGSALPTGTYKTSYGFSIKVNPGRGSRIADRGHPKHGQLAGSSITMDKNINNLMRWLDLPEQKIWAMATANPAHLLKLKNIGEVRAGADADLVLWEKEGEDYHAVCTWIKGRCVYKNMNESS